MIRSRALSASLLLAKVTNPNPYMQKDRTRIHALKTVFAIIWVVFLGLYVCCVCKLRKKKHEYFGSLNDLLLLFFNIHSFSKCDTTKSMKISKKNGFCVQHKFFSLLSELLNNLCSLLKMRWWLMVHVHVSCQMQYIFFYRTLTLSDHY